MKINISKRTELMMAQAVALSQNGRMKSHIHARGNDLFIANMDNTIVIHFITDTTFPEALDFFANDYESSNIEVSGGMVNFITTRGGYAQTKTCGIPKTTFEEVKKIWDHYASPDKSHPLILRKDLSGMLDPELSHVEFHAKNGSMLLVQKNIYTGGRYEVMDAQSSGGLIKINVLPLDFKAMGMRTQDFQALFAFADTLTIYPQVGKNWFGFASDAMEGVVAACIYDELPYITDTDTGVIQEEMEKSEPKTKEA